MAAALALTALLSAPATAQQLVGRVLDGATQEPIEDAVLTLIHPDGPALGDPVRSDDSGAFTLPIPGPGSYFVKTERQDYAGFVDGVFAFDSVDARLEVTVYLLRGRWSSRGWTSTSRARGFGDSCVPTGSTDEWSRASATSSRPRTSRREVSCRTCPTSFGRSRTSRSTAAWW